MDWRFIMSCEALRRLQLQVQLSECWKARQGSELPDLKSSQGVHPQLLIPGQAGR